MSIVGLLTEIYSQPNLKMSLKFEIEVLFKKLGVDVKDVTQTALLKDKVRQVEGNPDFSNKDVNVDQQHFTGDDKTSTISQLPTATSGVDQLVVVNTKPIPWLVPALSKDYAMEADEPRIRNSAHKMVASLAGSLAHVTCKVPLFDSLSTQLRSSLQGLNYASELVKQAVQMVIDDNLDLACVLIEQSAVEKGIQAIDADLPKQLSIIRKQRERVVSDYFDPANFPQGNTRSLPDALRPKPGRLSHPQCVYEDFIKLPWVLSDTGNAGVTATTHASVDNETRPTQHDR